jgi:hypothetical protein
VLDLTSLKRLIYQKKLTGSKKEQSHLLRIRVDVVHVGHSVLQEHLKVLTSNLKTNWSVFQSNNSSIVIKSAKAATEE